MAPRRTNLHEKITWRLHSCPTASTGGESPTQLQLLYRFAQIRFLRFSRTQPSAPQMKIAVLLLCLAAAFGAAAAVAPPCNGTALTQLLSTGDVRACSAMFGNGSTSLEPASDAQVTAVCNNSACMKSLGALKQVAPNECTIGPILLHANIIDPILQRCANKTRSAGSAGSVSASGSGAGPSVGDVSGSASGSGPMAGDVDGGGSATKSPATSKPRTNSPANPRTGSASKAPGNEAPTLSTCAAIVVLAAVVAALV